MMRMRVLVGTGLILAAAAVLLLDAPFAPLYPFFAAAVGFLAVRAARELWLLLDVPHRPPWSAAAAAVLGCLAANWLPVLLQQVSCPPLGSVWSWLVTTYAIVVISVFLLEMARFPDAGAAIPRIAGLLLIASYLGVLPVFVVQLRFAEGNGIGWLAVAILIPKGNDIAAYFTGKLLGRQKMAPRLSPKKTWEGCVGGLLGGVAVAVGIERLAPLSPPLFPGGWAEAAMLGLVAGAAGILGDLAESLLKRDRQVKDAANLLPGFGGILDLIDSVLFAAPVVYLWYAFRTAYQAC